MPTYAAQAAWTGDRWIENAILHCSGGRIRSLESASAHATPIDVDFGEAMILPGFINAHAHLEYSFLHRRLDPTSDFPHWLGEVVRLRRETPDEAVDRAIPIGLRMALGAGTTTLLDISTRGNALGDLRHSGLRAWSFQEIIQMDPALADEALAVLAARLIEWPKTHLVLPALSPHTPYTVSLELAQAVGDLARARQLPLAIHLSETREERQMVEQGEGPLFELFHSRGLLPRNWKASEVSPVHWAARAGLLGPNTYAIHCNYLEDREIELLARTNTTVVYCPASHAFFGHPPHPIERLRAAGVNLAIGTDSLASNDALDLLRELRLVRKEHPAICAEELLAMIGRNAAGPLGAKLGVLAPDACADFTVVSPCPADPGERLRAMIEDEGYRVAAVVVNESIL